MGQDDLAQWVRSSLQGKIDGPGKAFYELLEELKNGNDTCRLRDLFAAIAENSAMLSKYHEELDELLTILFLFDWSFGSEVSIAFERIICGLVSSNAGFLLPVFQLLVQNFYPGREDEDEEDEDEDEDEEDARKVDDTENDDVKRERLNQIHRAVRSILSIIPLGCTTLLTVLFAEFPAHRESTKKQETFIRQALRVCEYTPILRDRILALTIERLLVMDSEILLDDLEEKDENANGMFSMEDDTAGQPAPQVVSKDVLAVRAIAERLDILLGVLFDFSDKQISKNRRMGKVYFDLVVNIVDRLVMRTNGAKFTQFLIFYICRKRADFVDSFIERLLQRALGDDVAAPVRLSSASYLASFVARGLFIRADSTHSTLQHMMGWIQTYATCFQNDEQQDVIDPREHLQFFAVCQAVIYILMFKGEDLTVQALQAMRWDIMVSCRLQPFSYFSADILEEFARFANAKGLVDVTLCREINQYIASAKDLEKKSGGSAPPSPSGLTSGAKEFDFSDTLHLTASREYVAKSLSAEYPFDPCLLRRTAERIEPFYQHWLSCEGDEHTSEYELCDAEIERSNADLEEYTNEGETDAQEVNTEQGAQELPPAIRIHGLSNRAAYMLQQLGGTVDFKAFDQGGELRNDTGYWGFNGPRSFASDEEMGNSEIGSPLSLPSGDLRYNMISSSSHMLVSSYASSSYSMGSEESGVDKPRAIDVPQQKDRCVSIDEEI
eukprot:CAMPEP_0203749820 /NCGR_PEP_ID=MMETSP0098-20131031/4225_1 /ASSEMBLY_ACC=CAM_ASM_000208 /TAXON_ID=96639 /ORGANISM=" , Strain NY0313808BC1" /LENGTH=723 /DNA_ID=CAMNT_0050638931 /DNA_START=300 /DNA_END=2468 /DNA_ORIENTATION=+